jgi:hypothetical protein
MIRVTELSQEALEAWLDKELFDLTDNPNLKENTNDQDND